MLFWGGPREEQQQNVDTNVSTPQHYPSLIRSLDAGTTNACKNCKCFASIESQKASEEQQAKANLAFLAKDSSKKLSGTFPKTDLQIFVLREDRSQWESEIQQDALMKKIDALCRRQFRKEFNLRVKLYWCEAQEKKQQVEETTTIEGTQQQSNALSILIVPAMTLVQNIEQGELPQFIESYLKQETLTQKFPSVRTSQMDGTHVFICCHGTRDETCGAAGDVLFDTMREYIVNNNVESRLQKQKHINHQTLYMHKTSCLTGHIHPANMIVVRWDEGNSKYYADSYGYVTPNDVPRLMREHILKGNVVPQLFKGRVTLDPAIAEKFLKLVCNYDHKNIHSQ